MCAHDDCSRRMLATVLSECAFKIGGMRTEIVSRYCRLGHIISSSLNDEQDILHRRNAFIGQVYSVLCFFGKLPSAAKARLFHSYCTSYYGCVLWDLSCSVVGNFCTAWRKSIRRIWNLPYQAHGYLLSLAVCLPMTRFVWDLWISCLHVLLIAAILPRLSHGTAFSMDGLAHQLAVICCTVHSGIHVLWKTCFLLGQSAMLSIHVFVNRCIASSNSLLQECITVTDGLARLPDVLLPVICLTSFVIMVALWNRALLWSPYGIGRTIIFFPVASSFSFLFLLA